MHNTPNKRDSYARNSFLMSLLLSPLISKIFLSDALEGGIEQEYAYNTHSLAVFLGVLGTTFFGYSFGAVRDIRKEMRENKLSFLEYCVNGFLH